MNRAAPRAEALAIAGNRIAAVGGKADILALRAKHTRLIDAGMKTVMPGIVEGHVHLFGGSVELDSLMLNGINGFDRIAESVSQYRKSRPGPGIVVATGIAHESFGRDTPITRQLLDRIVADVPFIAVCFDHHTVWANTRAIEAAGVMRGRQLPTGNEIVLDAGGLATGELREPAAYMFALALTPTGGREWLGMTTGENPVPPATAAERAIDEAYFRKGIAHAASLGITSMHNMDGNLYQLERLQALLDRSELDARVEVPFHQKNFFDVSRLDEAVEWRARFKGDILHCGRVKSSSTAFWGADRPDARRSRLPPAASAPLFTAEFSDRHLRRRHGAESRFHAIGGGVRRTSTAMTARAAPTAATLHAASSSG
jgi:predicted amidohydrolase YtcJ